MGIRFQMIQGRGTQDRMRLMAERMKTPFGGNVGPQACLALRAGVSVQFERQMYITTTQSSKWPKRKTAKGRKAGSWPILNKTGRLKGDWVNGSIQRIEAKRIEIGVTVPYAGFHQRGTRRMVARKVGVTPTAVQQIGKLIRDRVLDKTTAQKAVA